MDGRNMSKKDINIVRKHNKWRRGSNVKMADPKQLGIALDNVLAMAERAEEMERALKVIYTWAAFQPIDFQNVQALCEKALGLKC